MGISAVCALPPSGPVSVFAYAHWGRLSSWVWVVACCVLCVHARAMQGCRQGHLGVSLTCSHAVCVLHRGVVLFCRSPTEILFRLWRWRGVSPSAALQLGTLFGCRIRPMGASADPAASPAVFMVATPLAGCSTCAHRDTELAVAAQSSSSSSTASAAMCIPLSPHDVLLHECMLDLNALSTQYSKSVRSPLHIDCLAILLLAVFAHTWHRPHVISPT